ncbi:MAG: EamA family transporter, partial [Promethearchaeota archaeon]
MTKENYIKGIPFAIIALFLVSLQPIVANSRPEVLDSYIFAAMTCIIQVPIFFPMVLVERKQIRASIDLDPTLFEEKSQLLNGWKKNKLFLIYIGIIFAIAQVLFFIAYQYAGAINGSLAQQTIIIFGLLFGFLINREKISYKQIIFSVILFFGLFLAVTQGKFNLIEFNIGVLLMLLICMMWMSAHALSKRI